MPLKRRRKPNAEFSVASLTDIIFLLLIFFMLTANFVQVKPFELPESDSKTVAPTSIVIGISKNSDFYHDATLVQFQELEEIIKAAFVKSNENKDFTVTIVAEVGTPFEEVIEVMKIAGKLKVKSILATQPKPKS
ncbi:MAG TPA: biopolymer transporter ExbD [Haliscomenobacter sp.]|uniref:ExbD/TolR family protein n=1 Tax=Haliscomenobacter sp. TaxID=2717303 RepID=UPI001E0D9666|nr:biopolymer transporter ExbD [Haliscomenobacter sp.]MBK9489493.1 biopolymer transporter ExbD [Haliscomenobacter sp.]HOY19066.1 biopolymer transporter ExbD [Haliscomenobacter sp.]